MEFTNNPRGTGSNRPLPGGHRPPNPQRRVFTDFGVRPAAPRPAAPLQPATAPLLPASKPITPHPAHLPATPKLTAPRPQPHHTAATPSAFTPPTIAISTPVATPTPAPPTPSEPIPPPSDQPSRPFQQTDADTPPEPKLHIRTGHAGLVGLAVFVVLGGLLLSPLIPGKILSLPGSSQSSSSGDQALACINTPDNITTTTAYHSKLGSLINYNYSSTTTQHASCDGKQQTAISGHTSQFSPLGLAIDLAAAVIVAVVVSKAWRKIFSDKD